MKPPDFIKRHLKQQQSRKMKDSSHGSASCSGVADINECEEQMSACPENSECLNVPGSFICSGLFRPSDGDRWVNPCF